MDANFTPLLIIAFFIMLVGLFIMVQVCKEYYWLQSLGGMDTLLFDLEDDDYDS
tara:strand:- start:766 stop:927 length:162 start_codon:yes stop_codon:yes gene_type:complete